MDENLLLEIQKTQRKYARIVGLLWARMVLTS